MELIPGDGKQTLTKYRARNHDIYIGQWGVDYWDPNSNAETFTSNPNNADDSPNKTLAWRNAWDVPELTKETKAALLERDNTKRADMYKALQKTVLRDEPLRADLPADRSGRPAQERPGLQARADLRHQFRRAGDQVTSQLSSTASARSITG